MENRYFIIFYCWFDTMSKMYLYHLAASITNGVYVNHRNALHVIADKHKAEGHNISPQVISITNIIEISESDYIEFIK